MHLVKVTFGYVLSKRASIVLITSLWTVAKPVWQILGYYSKQLMRFTLIFAMSSRLPLGPKTPHAALETPATWIRTITNRKLACQSCIVVYECLVYDIEKLENCDELKVSVKMK